MNVLKSYIALIAMFVAAGGFAAEEKILNVYNWSDYIAADTLANFEKETGIKVVYDVFDSNDVLEAKLLSGKTGYDVVVPSSSFLARQIKAGVFQTLDTSKLPNHKELSPKIMARLQNMDPGNAYSVPYLWGTTGIGINVAKVKERLGDDFPLDSWSLVFDPKIVAKLADCGVTVLDAWDEMIPAALNYAGEDPQSTDPELFKGRAQEVFMAIRPYVRYFHSSQYINDLANGDVCLSVGWSGDILQAMERADEAQNGVEIAYIIPQEGAGLWFDMLAIPADAQHVDNAHVFLNYLMRPDVMAAITNYVWYPNAIPASKPLIKGEIVTDPSIYPAEEVEANLYMYMVYPSRVDRVGARVWTAVKTGR